MPLAQAFMHFVAIVLGCVTFLALLIRLSSSVGLVQRPGGRRVHVVPTPVVGGMGMSLALLAGWALDGRTAPDAVAVAGVVAMLALGIWDDRHDISARHKFIGQSAIALATVIGSGTMLVNMGEVLPGIHLELGALAIPMTVFAVLSVVNAVNMIDGLDGLAGMQLLVAFLGLGIATLLGGNVALAQIVAMPAAAILGFLLFNLRPLCGRAARTFMGDAGSMTLGFLLAMFAIQVTQPHAAGTAGVPPAVALWVCAVPLLDGISVILMRKSRGVSISSPGRDHLHHLFLERGASVERAVWIMSLMAVLCAAVGVGAWLLGMPDWALTSGFLVAGVLWHGFVARAWASVGARRGKTQAGLVSGVR